MTEAIIVQRMNEYLYKAAQSLSAWLEDMLSKSGDDWWEECVISSLSYNQREIAKEKGFTKLSDFDLAALLRIADKSWYVMRSYAFLPTREREVIRDIISVRNNWAHCSAELPGKDIIISDIEKLINYFFQMNKQADVNSLEDFKKEIENLSSGQVSNSQVVEPENITEEKNSVVYDDSKEIKEKSLVFIVGTPAIKGMVFAVSQVGNTKKYEVFVEGKLQTYYEGQISLVDEKSKMHWVDSDTLRSYLSAYQINNPSASNLYSLNSARIDFVPYQFRPALKMIKSDEPRILIADSVGVGKTIEAGLIIKEIEARHNLESVMIVCPKPLVADRKWENEMKRFDEDFIPLNGSELRQIISDTDRDGEWPSRHGKTIVPYSILDRRVYFGEDNKKKKCFGLVDLDPAPHWDLVIIDEAHHLRNGSMEKEKAFAYKCVRYFCEHADAVVMLTATPLQTSDDDLFTLLNLLRPDIIIDKQSFRMMSRPNADISKASMIVRAAKLDWKQKAKDAIEHIVSTQWGENVIVKNPLYNDILLRLSKDEISRDDRVKLISDIESLHSFNTMINRTRRKDIQDFCIRRTFTLESEYTPEQRALHDEILTFEVAALSKLHGARCVKFMMSTIRRQAASCIFGLAPHIHTLIERRFDQLIEDPDLDVDAGDFKDVDIDMFTEIASNILNMAENLPEKDPKFDSTLEIIMKKQQQDNNKIILFSTFKNTLNYLKNKLSDKGIRVAQIDGSVGNDDRLELRYRFELPKDNHDAIDILLFTEVGSEGLDYQFCDTMINYDLPWNPMRIEQRIGRIDRRGQISEVVNIYNPITSDTIDADIYHRCLARIGVFENSVGECEEILGEIGHKIEMIALDTGLSDEERCKKLEQMADNEIRKAQELNKLESEEKELFGFDLSNYVVSKEIQEAESPFLTGRSINHLVNMYLQERLGEGTYIIGDSDVKNLRLSAIARSELLKDFRAITTVRNSYKKAWELYLKGNIPNHIITFEQDAAEKNRKAFFINSLHPLVKQAAKYFAVNEVAYIHMEYSSDSVPKGDYPMSIYAWNYVGVNTNFKLTSICENEEIAQELPEYLLTASAIKGFVDVKEDTWERLENKHIEMWQTAKKEHVESTQQIANFKIESIKNNYKNRKLVLERNIAEATDDRIKIMRQVELENATERYKQRVYEIKEQISKADIHTTLIANGIISVK